MFLSIINETMSKESLYGEKDVSITVLESVEQHKRKRIIKVVVSVQRKA